MIRNIILTLDNVIYDVDYSIPVEQFNRLGFPKIESAYGLDVRNTIFKKFEEGHVSIYTFAEKVNELLESNLSVGDIDGFMRSHITVMHTSLLDLLAKIQGRFNIYLVANCNPLVKMWLNSFEFSDKYLIISLFDKIFYSCDIGQICSDYKTLKQILDSHNLELHGEETIAISNNYQFLEDIKAGGDFWPYYTTSSLECVDLLGNIVKYSCD